MAQKRRSFTAEYKREVAKEVVESSRPVATVTREQGVNEQTVRNWVNDYRKEHASEEPPLTLSERARLRELEKEVRELRAWKGFPGKSRGLLREELSVTQRYEFIEAEKDTLAEAGERKYTITKMCDWMGVSTSGYYEWRDRARVGHRRATHIFVPDGGMPSRATPMITQPEQETTWGELYVGSRSIFAAAGFAEVSKPTPRRVVMRIDF